MTENCSHDCGSCQQDCASRDLHEPLHNLSRVGTVYGVVRGKGGVGKSLVTSLLAVQLQKQGVQAAILDADITGPSIPKMFGAKGKITGTEDSGFFPVTSRSGIEMVSTNFLLDHDTDPVVWRGPIIAGTVKQFWGSMLWDDIDVMLVDMPPGTGDVPLTVFQSLPLDGVIIVTSPQDLVSMIVTKAVRMAELMHVPIVGLIENMAYFRCPNCGSEHAIFGKSHIEQVAAEHGLKVLARLPIDPALTALCDAGKIEDYDGQLLADVANDLK